MPKNSEDKVLIEGMVEEALPSLVFKVKPADGGESVLAHLAGRLKMHFIKVVPGDRVIVEVSRYDRKRGRIVRRL